MTDLYGHDPMEPTEAQVEEHIASQMTDKERRIAEINAEYERNYVKANSRRDDDMWKADNDFCELVRDYKSMRDAKIRAIEEEA